MPRIVHVISTRHSPGGGEVVLRQLVEGLSQRDWEQLVLNPFAPVSHRDRMVPDDADAGYAARAARNIVDVPGLRSWMRREIRLFKPDIIHAHLFHAAVLLATIPRQPQEHRVLTHHHGSVFDLQARRMDARSDRWAASTFDHVVAVSNEVRKFLTHRYRRPLDRTSVIRNGWDERFARLRPDYSANEIVCVANLRKEKALDVLLRGFAAVATRYEDAALTVVGEGPMRRELEALARELSVADSVRFVGFAENVEPYLEKASVFCFSSGYETLGIAAMEAMAAGLPVVATSVGGVPEIVKDGSTGFLVEPGNHSALASRLADLLESRLLRERMGVAARTAVAPYSKQRMVDQYLDLYTSLLGVDS